MVTRSDSSSGGLAPKEIVGDVEHSKLVSKAVKVIGDSKFVNDKSFIEFTIICLSSDSKFLISKINELGVAITTLKASDSTELELQLLEEEKKVAEKLLVETERKEKALEQEGVHLAVDDQTAAGGQIRLRDKLGSFKAKVEEAGSVRTLEKLEEFEVRDDSRVADQLEALLDNATKVLEKMEKAGSISFLHRELKKFPDSPLIPADSTDFERKQVVELHALLKTFLEFNVGLKTIDKLFPIPQFEMQKGLITRW